MSDEARTPLEGHEEPLPLEDIDVRSGLADFLSGLFVFAVALYALIESYNMPSFGEPDEMNYNTPGLTPMVVSGVLVVLSAALMIRSRKLPFRFEFGGLQIETIRVWITLAIITVFIIMMPFIGYAPATFLMLVAFQLAFARKRDWRFILIWVLGLSAVLTGVLYYVFHDIFMIPLP